MEHQPRTRLRIHRTAARRGPILPIIAVEREKPKYQGEKVKIHVLSFSSNKALPVAALDFQFLSNTAQIEM